jgi:deoxyribodipyrimidine photo-lyase
LLPAPRRVVLPDGLAAGELPPVPAGASPGAVAGGETPGRRRLRAFRGGPSGLSPYLHFGCVSALAAASASDLSSEFVRQLCWRDFFHQVLAAFPGLGREPYRKVGEAPRQDPGALAAWQEGRTGVPIVDAAMRQLMAEGTMDNRSRLITAAFLTRSLGLDWRAGAAWYARWLVDADIANNNGNWQWVAGTGNDTKPYRRFNPVRQAHRFDPQGEFVRRWVPELAGVAGGAVHEPWRLPAGQRRGYPSPIDDGMH